MSRCHESFRYTRTVANERDYPCSVEGCSRAGYARGWCAPHYNRWRRYGDPTASTVVRGTDRAAYLLHYSEAHASGCRVWTGGLSNNGYGQARTVDGRPIFAHRLAYETWVGPIPDKMEIDHACHNDDATCVGQGSDCWHRRCIEPTHLRAVSKAENMANAAHKRRQTHCGLGHQYDYVDARGRSVCRQCSALRKRRQRA